MNSENPTTAIKAENITKVFGDFTAVDHISFEVKRGEIFGFLGANGAGKTTAMRMLCGLSKPTGGTASVAGFDVYTQNEQIKKNIGYMSQKFSLYEDLTVKENMQLYGGIYGKSDAFIKEKTAFILDHLRLENEANKLVAALPLGWKQKLAFSVAIFHEPEIVFWSHYIDEKNSPLFAFGHGLSYSKFEYSQLKVSSSSFTKGESIQVQVELKNNSAVEGKEVVQLYIRDMVGSFTRPVKELKGFEMVSLKPFETKVVSFSIDQNMLA